MRLRNVIKPQGLEPLQFQLSFAHTPYLVHDVYARFIRPEADEAHYVRIARITTLVVMVLSAGVTLYLDSIRQAWEFILEAGAGIGLVLILRWYWWRVNAWSEIAAMVAPILGYAWLARYSSLTFPDTLMVLVAWSTVSWLVVTAMTSPETDATLVAFYLRARPGGPGWTRVASLAGAPPPAPIHGQILDWLAGVVLIYATLFGVGAFVIPGRSGGVVLLLVAVTVGAFLYRRFARRGAGPRSPRSGRATAPTPRDRTGRLQRDQPLG